MNSEMKLTHFEKAWARVRDLTGWSDYKELGAFVGSSPQSVSGVKKRGKFPLEWARKIGLGYGSSTDYIMDGTGPVHTHPAAFAKVPDLSTVPDYPPLDRADADRMAEETLAIADYKRSLIDDPEINEIIDMLRYDLPEAKKFVLMVLRGRKEIKQGLEGLGMKLKEDK